MHVTQDNIARIVYDGSSADRNDNDAKYVAMTACYTTAWDTIISHSRMVSIAVANLALVALPS